MCSCMHLICKPRQTRAGRAYSTSIIYVITFRGSLVALQELLHERLQNLCKPNHASCPRKKNWVHSVCTSLSCIRVVHRFHVSLLHDLTACVRPASVHLYGRNYLCISQGRLSKSTRILFVHVLANQKMVCTGGEVHTVFTVVCSRKRCWEKKNVAFLKKNVALLRGWLVAPTRSSEGLSWIPRCTCAMFGFLLAPFCLHLFILLPSSIPHVSIFWISPSHMEQDDLIHP